MAKRHKQRNAGDQYNGTCLNTSYLNHLIQTPGTPDSVVLSATNTKTTYPPNALEAVSQYEWDAEYAMPGLDLSLMLKQQTKE